METNKTIEQTLDTFIPNQILKKKKSPLMSIVYLLAGLAVFIVNSTIEYDPGGYLYPLNLSVGSILLLVGLISFFLRKNHYYDVETGEILENHDVFLDSEAQTQIINLLESGDLANLSGIKKSAVHRLKLHIMATKDGRWCFAQLFLFVPHQYKPVTDVLPYDADKAKTLRKALDI